MTYKLWETETRNLLDSYASETEALSVVRAEIEANGDEYVDTWALVRVEAPGQGEVIAEGLDLARRARSLVHA